MSTSLHRPDTGAAQATILWSQAFDSEKLSLVKHQLTHTFKVWAQEGGHRETLGVPGG